jgi:putative endonuclease
MRQHREHVFGGFTARYNIDRLVWYHTFGDIRDAIAREKQLKGWRREKKIRLIESQNPTWQDLSEEWGQPITLKDILCHPTE